MISPEKWFSVSPSVATALCAQTNMYYPFEIFDPETSSAEALKLPFHPRLRLCRLETIETTPPLSAHILSALPEGAEFFLLNGDIEPLQDAHATAEPDISTETVVAYLSFFFRHVFPPEGQFHLITQADDIVGLEKTEANFQRSLKFMIHPPRINKTAEGWTVETFLAFDPHLYRARLNVTPTGNVDILDERVISDSLPWQTLRKV